MGYRLHFVQHFAPEYKGGYFNWDSEQWETMFYDRFNENGWADENGGTYEIYREDVQEYINEIKGTPEAKNKYMKDYTNAQVIEVLEEILTSDDDNIRLEWF